MHQSLSLRRSGLILKRRDRYSLLDADKSPVVAQKLREIQSNERGLPSAIGNQYWSGLTTFTDQEEVRVNT